MRHAALILPDIDVRHEFETLIRAKLPALELRVMDPLPGWSSDAALEGVEAVFTFGQFLTDVAMERADKLRWIQSLGTGVDGIVDRPTLPGGVWVTNARGVHSACVSETAFAMMLALARDLPGLVRAQDRHQWLSGPARLLTGKTVGILGVGLIAEGLAQRCKAFEMRVEGLTSRTEAPNFDRLRPYADLMAAVGNFDYFVLLAPLSAATRHLVNAEVLGSMKPGSILINVARGGLLDEAALIRALNEGTPAAAGLDVFSVEPLPPESPLWDMRNVIISPHTAGQHREYAQSVMPIVAANCAAMSSGRESELVNIVRHPL